MAQRHLFLTSSGLSEKMKERFFELLGKDPAEAKILYIPTAGMETDGAREGFAICLHELFSMGIRYENILIYNLELLLSKGYERTYSAYVREPHMVSRLLTAEEWRGFDAVFVSGGDCAVLCREMTRTGLGEALQAAVHAGIIYVGISAGSMYAAGNFAEGLHVIDNPLRPHWEGSAWTQFPADSREIPLADGQAVYVEGDHVSLL